MLHHFGIVVEPVERRASLDASPRRSSVFTDKFKLYDELLALMILRLHWARSASPPGPEPGRKSPARSASSHSVNLASSVLPCLSRVECLPIFSFLYVFLYCLQSTAAAVLFKLFDADSLIRTFARDITSKLKIICWRSTSCLPHIS